MVENGTAVNNPTDAELLASSAEDTEAFRAFFERHYRPVWSFLAWRFGESAADDACAETFATAFRNRERYDHGVADARPWLLGIAVNHARHHARRERKRLGRLACTLSSASADPASISTRAADSPPVYWRWTSATASHCSCSHSRIFLMPR